MTAGRRGRFAVLLVAVCLLAVSAVVWVGRAGAPAAAGDDPQLRPAVTTTTAPPTTAPAPTTTLPQPAPPSEDSKARSNGPVVQIGTIEIPAIGLVHPIFEGMTLTEIDHGPSHWPGTAMPGQTGNAVFAGHRVTHTHPFLRIDELKPGDPVVFDVGGVRWTYRVTGSQVVTPKQTEIVQQTPTATATLFACHPPHSARYRYVVHLALAAA